MLVYEIVLPPHQIINNFYNKLLFAEQIIE